MTATILIVDDYPVIQRTLSHTLTKHGYEVHIAGDGLAALALLSGAAVDAAIVDIAMPEMDGLTLLQTLRADARHVDLPVIILTASGQDEDRMAAEAAGATRFLNKPVSSHQLLETVAEVLNG